MSFPACVHVNSEGLMCPFEALKGENVCGLHLSHDKANAKLCEQTLSQATGVSIDSFSIQKGAFQARLRDLTLQAGRLSELNMVRTFFQRIRMQEVLWRHSSLKDSALDSVLLTECSLNSLSLTNTALVDCRLENCHLQRLHFRDCRLHRTLFAGLQGHSIILENCLLEECEFLDLDLAPWHLRNCRLIACRQAGSHNIELEECRLETSEGF